MQVIRACYVLVALQANRIFVEMKYGDISVFLFKQGSFTRVSFPLKLTLNMYRYY